MTAAPSARAMRPQDDTPPPTDGKIPAPANTVWMVPDIDYDKQVIGKYLARKYSNLPKEMIQSQVNMQALPHLPDVKLVVLGRRQPEEGTPVGPSTRVEFNQFKNANEHIPIPPETYVHEVYESPPVRVGDYVHVTPGQIFRPQETNIAPLIDVLCAHAAPNRITPQSKPDFMLRYVWGG